MNKMLAGEYMVSVSIVSWGALKAGYYPWPPSIVYTSIAYSLLSFVSLLDEDFASLLGGGFLLAQLIKAMSGTDKIPDFIYKNLEGNPLNGATPFSFYKMKVSAGGGKGIGV